MVREFTCIMCPMGCDIIAEYEGKEILSITGQTCKRGEEYVRQEMTSGKWGTAFNQCPPDKGDSQGHDFSGYGGNQKAKIAGPCGSRPGDYSKCAGSGKRCNCHKKCKSNVTAL